MEYARVDDLHYTSYGVQLTLPGPYRILRASNCTFCLLLFASWEITKEGSLLDLCIIVKKDRVNLLCIVLSLLNVSKEARDIIQA
ncbi:hypothetical protein H5410_048712 [Solanum commersonii]|uniref:Uncharacterized protein n=1 Tax=Solanum commersonii TaxID=4109 RepID=A0A9J5XMJ1_SOLCO|nr:hypothetical protein H5410_048712 [Solanum commersonii]